MTKSSDMSANPAKAITVLFLDKVLLGPRPRNVRGVEIFNLNLIRDLAALGYKLTVPADKTWHNDISEKSGNRAKTLLSPRGFSGVLSPWRLIKLIGRNKFDVLLLGNVANRLVPTLTLLRLRRVASRCVLIAHREPSLRCLWAQKAWPSTVVAVNKTIAGHFEKHAFPEILVSYGVADADMFFPEPGKRDEGIINFCVIGRLDNAWKGSDTAIAAFRMLPDYIRGKCRLHLASFEKQPELGDPGIITYSWMPAKEMPAFLRRMDVMIVPSRDEEIMRETFSQAMVQGMLSGLPLIVNRLPILEEKLDQGGGLVFSDERELSAAMERLAANADERKRMGRTARETALARYVWDTKVFAQRFLP